MVAMLKKIRMIFGGSPRAGLLTAAFVLFLVLLLVMLWQQVHNASEVDFPVGQQHISGMMGAMTPGKDGREVLVLNSYHLGYSWSDNEMRGIVSFPPEGRPADPADHRFPRLQALSQNGAF
jgi:hypothetical protein